MNYIWITKENIDKEGNMFMAKERDGFRSRTGFVTGMHWFSGWYGKYLAVFRTLFQTGEE